MKKILLVINIVLFLKGMDEEGSNEYGIGCLWRNCASDNIILIKRVKNKPLIRQHSEPNIFEFRNPNDKSTKRKKRKSLLERYLVYLGLKPKSN